MFCIFNDLVDDNTISGIWPPLRVQMTLSMEVGSSHPEMECSADI
jgi:hypothetical protein